MSSNCKVDGGTAASVPVETSPFRGYETYVRIDLSEQLGDNGQNRYRDGMLPRVINRYIDGIC